MTWSLGSVIALVVLIVSILVLLAVVLSVGVAVPTWLVFLLIGALAVAFLVK